jgi:hypothetical protein
LNEPESISRVEVTAAAPSFEFWEYDAELISGGCMMSNGWRMKVDAASDGIVAQVDRQRPVRLIAISRDR